MDIAIVGEAWGEAEARERQAFIGKMSWRLKPMLEAAGIAPADCYMTNVFNVKYNGKPEFFCGTKAEGIPGRKALGKSKYVLRQYEPELARLASELLEVNPNLIIAAGNTPCWALLNTTGIGKLRGYTTVSTHCVSGFKVLPTYHPAAVIHEPSLEPTVIMDFIKAKREAEYPEIRRPKRSIWIEPTLEDLYDFFERYIRDTSEILSIDIETAGNQITCIGIAPGPRLALVVPFFDPRRKGRSYWDTKSAECEAWLYVKRVLELPHRKLFQNGLYDIAFLWRAYGIKVRGAEHDTMLLHHALQPEALKGLGYLGSIYCDEGNWKHLRDVETIKRDD